MALPEHPRAQAATVPDYSGRELKRYKDMDHEFGAALALQVLHGP